MRRGGAESNGERIPSRLRAVSTEPFVGLNSRTVRSWPELRWRVGCLTLRSTQAPQKFMWRSYLGSVLYTSQTLSTPHDCLKAMSLDRGKVEEFPTKEVELTGQPVVMSSWWPPPHHAHKLMCKHIWRWVHHRRQISNDSCLCWKVQRANSTYTF